MSASKCSTTNCTRPSAAFEIPVSSVLQAEAIATDFLKCKQLIIGTCHSILIHGFNQFFGVPQEESYKAVAVYIGL